MIPCESIKYFSKNKPWVTKDIKINRKKVTFSRKDNNIIAQRLLNVLFYRGGGSINRKWKSNLGTTTIRPSGTV